MRKNLRMNLATLLVSLVVALTVSCQKKTVALQNDSGSTTVAEKQSNLGDENLDSSAGIQEGKSDTTTGVVIQENIYFEFDKATLTPVARESLVKNGEWLRIHSDVAIIIEGHCDERGTNEYNLALGDRRAESVKKFLSDLGIDTSRLTTISYGEERPSDPRHNEVAWAKNRRAHFLIK